MIFIKPLPSLYKTSSHQQQIITAQSFYDINNDNINKKNNNANNNSINNNENTHIMLPKHCINMYNNMWGKNNN